ncbi:MAG TPA: ABC transporter permease [Dehalococcoidia bacterium]|nr:ABC transporter permease [Dehalococcoidia bacterium]
MATAERAARDDRLVFAPDTPATSIVSWPLAVARFCRRKPLGAFGGAITLVLIVMAIVHPWIATHDPNALNPNEVLHGISGRHYFGTDNYGRDVYSRVVYGAWASLEVSIISVAIGTAIGTAIGVVSGYFGGAVDMVLQRVVDAALAFPGLILAIALVGLVGPSVKNVSIAIGLVTFPSLSRIVRGPVLSIKEQPYLEAARSTGANSLRIMVRHILPNITAIIIVVVTARFGTAILVESSLSFLGLGPPPPTATWGSMLSGDAIYIMQTAWWLAFFPGAAITLVVLGFNLFGDALRDVLDPRLRGRA